MDTKLTASMEDYVEAISQIMAEKNVVRAKDIATRLGVTRPSVSGALKSLARGGLVNYVPYDLVTLTEEGKKVAHEVIHRHTLLREFFIDILGVNVKEAESAACSVEHSVSEEVVDKLAVFVKRARKDKRKAI